MSDIRAKIKELERLQKKVDFLKQVIDFPKKLKAGDDDEKVVLPEVVDIIAKVLTPIIEQLEAGDSLIIPDRDNKENAESLPGFTEAQTKALITLADRVINNKTSAKSKEELQDNIAQKPKKKVSSWTLDNQHLGGKKVKTLVLSQEVQGEVISLNEPFVVIKLESGKIHQATLDKIEVVNA